jgi:hypothetical protein
MHLANDAIPALDRDEGLQAKQRPSRISSFPIRTCRYGTLHGIYPDAQDQSEFLLTPERTLVSICKACCHVCLRVGLRTGN